MRLRAVLVLYARRVSSVACTSVRHTVRNYAVERDSGAGAALGKRPMWRFPHTSGLAPQALTLPVPFLVDDLAERLAGRSCSAAAALRFDVRIANGNSSAQPPLCRNIKYRLGVIHATTGEPADTRADGMNSGGKHDPLAQPSLIEDLCLLVLARHHQDDP